MEFFKFFKKKTRGAEETPLLKTRVAVPTAAPTLSPRSAQVVPRPETKVDIKDRHNRLATLDMTLSEADLDPEVVDINNRLHQRINRGHILDSDIEAQCHNSRNGQRSTAMVMDISPGGMLLFSAIPFQVGDELQITCEIGNTFTMNEKAVAVRLAKGRKYGVEFKSLSDASKKFITQLYGAVVMGSHT